MVKKLSLFLFSLSIFLTSVSSKPIDKLNKTEVYTYGYFIGSISKTCFLNESGILDKYEAINSIKGTLKLLELKEYKSVKNFVKEASLSGPCSKLMLEIWY